MPAGSGAGVQRVTTRNARFQQWNALLTNRTKRNRAGQFLLQGVRPITIAVERGWPVAALLFAGDRSLSGWATELLANSRSETFALSSELLAEVGEKATGAPELVAVMSMPPDDLDRIRFGAHFLGVAFDRPTSPGNIGSVIRSADAFGADGVIVTGHAADVYDPQAVRASTGSLFALPVVRAPSHREVLDWRETTTPAARPLVVGSDEHGDIDLDHFDLTGPVLLVVGNETAGLSTGWREACDHIVRIPMRGSASSLNAANAASVLLYEARRQRSRLGSNGNS